jgi:hypothetical protein
MAWGDELMFEEIKKAVGVCEVQGCKLGLGGWLLLEGAIILLIKLLIMLI